MKQIIWHEAGGGGVAFISPASMLPFPFLCAILLPGPTPLMPKLLLHRFSTRPPPT